MSAPPTASEGFQRWELPHIGARPIVAAASAVPAAPAGPTLRELEDIQQQARDDGHAVGLAEGRDEAKQQLQAQVAQLDALIAAAAQPLQHLDEQTEEALAQLAIHIARRVIARELTLDPTLVIHGVRQAVALLPAAQRELRVHMHPDDVAMLREQGVAESHWQLLADHALSRGDCRLESARSHLDGRVETRLAAVIDAVLGEQPAPDEVHG